MIDRTVRTPKLGPRELVYEDRNQQVHRITADFGGFQKTYFVGDHGARVGVVLPLDGKILLVRQYRLLIDGPSLEIPGGRVDDGETPAEAALRECNEEAAVEIGDLVPLVSYLPGMDVHHNPTTLFVARDVRDTERFQADDAEVFDRQWLGLDDCLHRISSGEIRCGLTIMGLMGYALMQRREA